MTDTKDHIFVFEAMQESSHRQRQHWLRGEEMRDELCWTCLTTKDQKMRQEGVV